MLRQLPFFLIKSTREDKNLIRQHGPMGLHASNVLSENIVLFHSEPLFSVGGSIHLLFFLSYLIYSFVHFVQVNLPVNVLPVTFPGHGHGQAFNAPDDLPKNVARTLNQGSSPMSMDFHPIQQTLLLGLRFFQRL